HQKVIEEAPAPGMDPATREAICQAAVRAAQAVNYEGAGTIEFIADASEGLRADRIWFMEMNTRLQVEHPVTEEITGQDLVEWQLRVASGEPLPLQQEELSINGWAMEARLYAEDPAKGFLPSTGRLDHLEFGPADRIETGVQEGGTVSPFYDPMIAKVISTGDDRGEAIEGLTLALAQTEVWPVKTNAGFLVRALEADAFHAGRIDTGFIAAMGDDLIPSDEPSESEWLVAARLATDDEPAALAGFRLNAPPRRTVNLARQGNWRSVNLAEAEADVVAVGSDRTDFYSTEDATIAGFRDGDSVVVFCDGNARSFDVAARTSGQHSAHDGDILSPMPGKIIAVEVAAGDMVTKGQKLLTLEAMKMEHTLTAPFDGTVAELNAVPGAQVQVEALLARIEAGE
ncbi:MAG: methylcrotonoyl-CoA carboxylase, partial [Proteobacteria bacterium]|nr:methylcrotonoyl-CoA carboxylase [Pseudomonadota bacterium]